MPTEPAALSPWKRHSRERRYHYPLDPYLIPVSTEPRLLPAWRRHWPKIFLASAVLLFVVALHWFLKIDNQLRRTGHRFTTFTLEADNHFFVGIQDSLKSWSEQGGGLDTALDEQGGLETGVLRLTRPRDPRLMVVRTDSWIRTEERSGTHQSYSIPASDPSIRPAAALVGPKQQIRRFIGPEAARTGRVLPFLFPRWPDHAITPKTAWDEKIEWTEYLGEWTIHWSATRRWHLIDFNRCRDSHCGCFRYDTIMTPTIVQGPRWSVGKVLAPRFQGHGNGEVSFDAFNNRPVESTFTSEGDLRIPIVDLRAIPAELRRIPLDHLTPGEIVLRFKEKISITRP